VLVQGSLLSMRFSSHLAMLVCDARCATCRMAVTKVRMKYMYDVHVGQFQSSASYRDIFPREVPSFQVERLAVGVSHGCRRNDEPLG